MNGWLRRQSETGLGPEERTVGPNLKAVFNRRNAPTDQNDLAKCDMILGQIWSGYQSIRFIEKRYRKRDPKYADYAIGQQQEIIRRLNVEWDRSQCEDTDRINWVRKKGNL